MSANGSVRTEEAMTRLMATLRTIGACLDVPVPDVSDRRVDRARHAGASRRGKDEVEIVWSSRGDGRRTATASPLGLVRRLAA